MTTPPLEVGGATEIATMEMKTNVMARPPPQDPPRNADVAGRARTRNSSVLTRDAARAIREQNTYTAIS